VQELLLDFELVEMFYSFEAVGALAPSFSRAGCFQDGISGSCSDNCLLLIVRRPVVWLSSTLLNGSIEVSFCEASQAVFSPDLKLSKRTR
jgi:hypothetical protein